MIESVLDPRPAIGDEVWIWEQQQVEATIWTIVETEVNNEHRYPLDCIVENETGRRQISPFDASLVIIPKKLSDDEQAMIAHHSDLVLIRAKFSSSLRSLVPFCRKCRSVVRWRRIEECFHDVEFRNYQDKPLLTVDDDGEVVDSSSFSFECECRDVIYPFSFEEFFSE